MVKLDKKLFDTYEIQTIIKLMGFVLWGVVSIIALPMFVGLGPSGGFESRAVLEKFWFYSGPGMGFLLGIIVLTILSFMIFKEQDKEINGIILHNPEKGIFGAKFAKKVTVFNTIFISLILFALLGLFSTQTQTFFSEIPSTQQQFTETADTLFSMYPASPAETFGVYFFIMLILFFLGLYFKKKGIPKESFLPISIPIVILTGLGYGIVNHFLRYSGSDIKLAVVMVFWAFLGLIYVLSGSMIPGLILHDENNLFYKLNQLFASDSIFYTTIGILVILFLIYLGVTLGRGRKKK